MSRNTKFLAAGLALLGAASLLAPVAMAQGASVYTEAQATSGHADYAAKCGGCHRANLAGGGDAPALGGSGFMASFGNRSVKDLYNFIAQSMPAGAPGSLSEEQYTNITAYLLYANGAKPGSTPLTKNTNVKVSSVADGKIVAEAIKPPVLGKMAAMEARARAEAAPPPQGLTVKGAVKNYIDVTDDMLVNPPDGEWLMYRRNYQGWSYSPLKQITPDNVKGLTLKWAWNMNEGG
ncbi:MAG TPA: c-type cytochrome, partial [Rhizomicrobium sp.]|nr:c-type cytochrome [Rhizomicrobium sp.]